MATQKFISDFNYVTTHYKLSPEEIEQAKEAARKDMKQAEMCFASVAQEIRLGQDMMGMINFLQGLLVHTDVQAEMGLSTFMVMRKRLNDLGLFVSHPLEGTHTLTIEVGEDAQAG